MNKIITVNIGGRAIKIEEDAHLILEKYLKKIESNFRQTENGAEILEDIEARISDLLQEKLDQGAAFISPDAVNEVIAQMGDPAEMEDEEEPNAKSSTKSERRSGGKQRKLYRDPDDRMVGGVCSGLGKYFNISPTLMRVGLLISLFIFGFGLIPYLILWAIIPKATTAAQKLEMEGINPTIDNIADSIRKEASDVADSLRNSGSVGNFIQRAIEVLAQVIKVVLKVFVVLFLIALSLGAIALFVGLILGVGSLSFAALSVDLDSVLQFHDSTFMSYFTRISLFFVLATPILGIILLLVRIIRNTPRLRALNIGLWSLWAISLICFIGSVIYTVRSVKTQGEYVEEITIAPADTLYVHYQDYGPEVEEVFNRSRVEFSPSSDWSLREEKSARGANMKEASDIASEIQVNSKVEGNHVYIDALFQALKTNVLRNQTVKYDLRVPEGTIVQLVQDINQSSFSHSIKVGKNTIRRNSKHRAEKAIEAGTYIMSETGLECIGCEKMDAQASNITIRRIEIDAPVELRVYQSSQPRFETSEGIEAHMSGTTLSIDYDQDPDDLMEKPSVEVFVKDLNELHIESLADVELENIKSDELHITLEGAASLDAEDLEINVLNLELDGASRVALEGKATDLNIVQNGGASIDAEKLVCSNANIIINGLSNCQLHVNNKITGSISGAGKLSYVGSPTVEVDTEGIIKVVQK